MIDVPTMILLVSHIASDNSHVRCEYVFTKLFVGVAVEGVTKKYWALQASMRRLAAKVEYNTSNARKNLILLFPTRVYTTRRK